MSTVTFFRVFAFRIFFFLRTQRIEHTTDKKGGMRGKKEEEEEETRYTGEDFDRQVGDKDSGLFEVSRHFFFLPENEE